MAYTYQMTSINVLSTTVSYNNEIWVQSAFPNNVPYFDYSTLQFRTNNQTYIMTVTSCSIICSECDSAYDTNHSKSQSLDFYWQTSESQFVGNVKSRSLQGQEKKIEHESFRLYDTVYPWIYNSGSGSLQNSWIFPEYYSYSGGSTFGINVTRTNENKVSMYYERGPIYGSYFLPSRTQTVARSQLTMQTFYYSHYWSLLEVEKWNNLYTENVWIYIFRNNVLL